MIHLVSRESPGKENQSSTSLAFQSTVSDVASYCTPVLGRKQEVCTLNFTGASELSALPVDTRFWTGVVVMTHRWQLGGLHIPYVDL